MKENKEFRDHRKDVMKRFLKAGIDGFLDHEILELLLILTTDKGDVRPTAELLLKKYKYLNKIHEAPITELIKVPKMSAKSAILLKIIRGCSEYYLRGKVKKENLLKCGPELINYLKMSMGEMRDEAFKTVFLNIQSEVIEIETINTGTLDQSVVYPRKIIERAIFHNAAALIFVHNHPSGSIRPSYADKELTNLLVSAAAVMDIEVYDHLIIAGDKYFSFRDGGLISNLEKSFMPVIRMSIHAKYRNHKGTVYRLRPKDVAQAAGL